MYMYKYEYVKLQSECAVILTVAWRLTHNRGKTADQAIALHVCLLSCFSRVQLCATLRTIAYQAPLSMGFSRQEYWNGLPCPLPGDLPDPGIKLMSVMSPALTGGFSTISATWEAPFAPHLVTNSYRRKKPRGKPRINFFDDLKGLSP